MRDIKVGDVVTVALTDGGAIPEAVVENIPSDVGDLWYFRKDKKVYAVNPMASSFEMLIKEAGNG